MEMDVFGKSGNYFRANCWSWRPIMAALQASGASKHIDPDTFESMHYNDGSGVKSNEKANQIAQDLEEWVSTVDWGTTGWSGDLDKEYYSVHKEHVLEWIEFLKECEGFEVC